MNQPTTETLVSLVRDFLDPDPCQFDHHGYCQAHAAGFGGEPGSCPHGRARKLLAAIDAAAPSPVSADGQRITLRDRIADVLAAADGWRWAPGFDRTSSPAYQGYLKRAADVMAVLPDPASMRAAVLREAADAIDAETRQLKADAVLEPDKFRPCRDAAEQLRRIAGEPQQPEICDLPHLTIAEEQACELRRVAGEEPATTETQAVVHACPPDGSGLTPCCGRTPFELPLTDRISSEASTTCAGAAAVARQDGEV